MGCSPTRRAQGRATTERPEAAGVYVETVENHKLDLAAQLVERAFPEDAPRTARVIIYGHS
jgi:hypothetical protein